MSHDVQIQDGSEYAGETYIRCMDCGVMFENAHLGTAALIEFLREHGAIT